MKSSLGLLALIVHSQMMEAASLEDLQKLQAEAKAEADAAQMELEKHEDAVDRLEEKLDKERRALKEAEGELEDAVYLLNALTERMQDGVSA